MKYGKNDYMYIFFFVKTNERRKISELKNQIKSSGIKIFDDTNEIKISDSENEFLRLQLWKLTTGR